MTSTNGGASSTDHVAQEALDETLQMLDRNAACWRETSAADKIADLRRIRANLVHSADDWVARALAVKALAPDAPQVGEEWLGGPIALLNNIDGLIATLGRKRPRRRLKTHALGEGRHSVTVFPQTLVDRLLLSGVRADVWVMDGIGPKSTSAGDTSVTLVLGAGNVTSIAPMDALYHLLHVGSTVLVKLNPVLSRFAALLNAIFAPLIARGVLRFVTGDGKDGARLVAHALVRHVHVTGSEATHDAIVFGDRGKPAEGGQAAFSKSISSELGGVCPTIVVPGRWTRSDLRYQAEHVATQKYNNAGCNCVATQVLILPRCWPQRRVFLEELRRVFADLPPRPLYYPGTAERLQPYALDQQSAVCGIVAVAPEQGSDLFETEVFGPLLAVVELDGDTAAAYLDNAVRFANERLRGTLGANLLIDPASRRALRKRFDDAIARLRFGTVAINGWTGIGYLLTATPWGAYPGHGLTDIQSGQGVVHNHLMLGDTEKAVVEAPFRPFPRGLLHGSAALLPRPPWFVSSRTGTETCRRLFQFYARPGVGRLIQTLFAALRS